MSKGKSVKATNKKMSVSIRQDVSYDSDFYKWTMTQAKLLEKGKVEKIDIANILEEVRSLGISEKRSLHSYLVNLLLHLLKINYQPQKHTKSWDNSIRNSRRKIDSILRFSPSLKKFLKEEFNNCYEKARKEASEETGLPEKTFPKSCPWKLNEVL